MNRKRQSKSQHLRKQLNLNTFILNQSKHIISLGRTHSKHDSHQTNQIKQLLGNLTYHHEPSQETFSNKDFVNSIANDKKLILTLDGGQNKWLHSIGGMSTN